LNIKSHENPCSGSRVVPYELTEERTDRDDEANSYFLQFCKNPGILSIFEGVKSHSVC